MSKFLLFALVGVGAYLVWWRGNALRKRELAEAEARRAPSETLVYDKERRVYVSRRSER